MVLLKWTACRIHLPYLPQNKLNMDSSDLGTHFYCLRSSSDELRPVEFVVISVQKKCIIQFQGVFLDTGWIVFSNSDFPKYTQAHMAASIDLCSVMHLEISCYKMELVSHVAAKSLKMPSFLVHFMLQTHCHQLVDDPATPRHILFSLLPTRQMVSQHLSFHYQYSSFPQAIRLLNQN